MYLTTILRIAPAIGQRPVHHMLVVTVGPLVAKA